MSLEKIQNVLENLHACDVWSIQLLNIRISAKTGVGYSSRQIILSPGEQLTELIGDIQKLYSDDGKKSLKHYREVRGYDDTADAGTIYRLSAGDEMIAGAYKDLRRVVADPNKEDDPFAYTSAYLLRGELELGGEKVPVKLFSMQKPVSTIRHKFSLNKGKFEAVPDKVISLRPAMDVIIIGETVYFLTAAGENLFDMERAYKSVCKKQIARIEETEIIHGMDQFGEVARSGHNPRRFLSFDEGRLKDLQKKSFRLKMAAQFSIPLDASGDKFDATVDGAAEKIVKLLCNKGMTDPFTNAAVEVDGARKWK